MYADYARTGPRGPHSHAVLFLVVLNDAAQGSFLGPGPESEVCRAPMKDIQK